MPNRRLTEVDKARQISAEQRREVIKRNKKELKKAEKELKKAEKQVAKAAKNGEQPPEVLRQANAKVKAAQELLDAWVVSDLEWSRFHDGAYGPPLVDTDPDLRSAAVLAVLGDAGAEGAEGGGDKGRMS